MNELSQGNVPSGNEMATLNEHLQSILRNYIKSRPHISLHSLSQRSQVSEPTLRRIYKGQIKTAPNVSTVLDVLQTVSGLDYLEDIIQKYQGPVAHFLKDLLLHDNPNISTTISPDLNDLLKESITYILFKLACNSCGVSENKVLELAGKQGMISMDKLQIHGLVKKRGKSFFSTLEYFRLSDDCIIDNFKTILNFLKPQNLNCRSLLRPFFTNFSSSIDEETYKKIVLLNKEHAKKIRDLITSESNQGNLPVFYISAFDTLDYLSPQEILEEQ